MKERIKNLYIENKLSREEVARSLGLPIHQLIYYLRKYDIKKNRKQEEKTEIEEIDEEDYKFCHKCKKVKKLKSFYLNENNVPGSWCKKCNKEAIVERQRKYKQKAVDYKGGKCEYCGYVGHPSAYDFHHMDKEKKEFIINIKNKEFDLSDENDATKKELDKCVLLCAICHRLVHSYVIHIGEIKEEVEYEKSPVYFSNH